jgi:hypothetical protein
MAALLAEFNAYLDRDGADPTADSVGYRQGTRWLSPDELAEMIGALRHVFASRAGNKPTPGRKPQPAEQDPGLGQRDEPVEQVDGLGLRLSS